MTKALQADMSRTDVSNVIYTAGTVVMSTVQGTGTAPSSVLSLSLLRSEPKGYCERYIWGKCRDREL